MSNEGRKGGRAVGRYGTQAGVLAVVFLAALPPYRLTAQVGHEPAESPFRDIVSHQHVYFQVGEFFGNRAKPGVGAQGGPTFGVRFRNRLSGPLGWIEVAAGNRYYNFVVAGRRGAIGLIAILYDCPMFD